MALNLISDPSLALWLESRAGLPDYVTVRVGTPNPWFGGCATVRISAIDAAGSVLDTKSFPLHDNSLNPANWQHYDCRGTTSLLLGGYEGPVTFAAEIVDGRGEGSRFSSRPITLNALPDGSAVDERDPSILNPADWDNLLGSLGNGIKDVAMLGVLLLGGVAAVAFAPTIKEALVGDDDE